MTDKLLELLEWLFATKKTYSQIEDFQPCLQGEFKLRGTELRCLNRHFGDWLLLHLLHKNIDRRTFQEIVNILVKSCSEGSKGRTTLKTNLSNIIEYSNDDIERLDHEDDVNTDASDKFFLPGDGHKRRVLFQD